MSPDFFLLILKRWPDKPEQQGAQFSATWFHSVGELGHGAPQQAAEVWEIRPLIGVKGRLQLLQKQHPHVPALDNVAAWLAVKIRLFSFIVVILFTVLLQFFFYEMQKRNICLSPIYYIC